MAESLQPDEIAKLAGLILDEYGLSTDATSAGAFITGLGVENAEEFTRQLMSRLNIKAKK